MLGDKKISNELSNQTLGSGLSKFFKRQELRYLIYGSTVVVMPKTLTSTTALAAELDQSGIYKRKVINSVKRKDDSNVTFLIQSNKTGSINDGNSAGTTVRSQQMALQTSRTPNFMAILAELFTTFFKNNSKGEASFNFSALCHF